MAYEYQDTWAEAVQPGQFGPLRIDILLTDDEVQLARAKHEYPRRDGADIQPMGTGARRTSCRVIFFERPPTVDDPGPLEDHLTRFSRFYTLCVTQNEALDFVHPIFGAYSAYADEGLRVSADALKPNVLFVDVDFVEDSTTPAGGFGPNTAPLQVSTAQLNTLCDAFDRDVAVLELPDDSAAHGLAADIKSTVAAWETNVDLKTRDVNGDLSRLSDDINDALNDINYGTDLDRIPLYRTSVRMHATLRRVAEAFQQRAPQIVDYVVVEDAPLRVLAARLYGAAQWERRYNELLELNDVTDPAIVPRGTVLRRILDNPSGVTGLAGVRRSA